MTLRVVVADDHGIVREGLAAVLSAREGFELVGTATTAAEAVRAAVTLRPDVVVMDIQMPDRSGIDATRDIRRAAPDVAVLMLTMFDDDASIFAAMRAGARGYVLKGDPPDHVVRAIAAVAAGEAIFGPGVARQALGYLSQPRSDEAFPELTRRARGARPDRPGAGERHDRHPVGPRAGDRGEPHHEHLRQAPGGQPLGGHRAGAVRRSRQLTRVARHPRG